MIISIFGPDGVGKTTHADMLARELFKRGYKVRRVWVKNNHTVAYLIIVLLKHISKRSVIMLSSNSILTNILARSGKMSKTLWLWIDSISVLVKLLFSVYILKLFGFIIVADRYLPDTITAMVLTVWDLKALETLPIKLLLSRIKKDKAVLIMLDCDYETIKGRRGTLLEPKQYIFAQKILYKVIAKVFGAPIIRTDRNVAETHREILNILDKLFQTSTTPV